MATVLSNLWAAIWPQSPPPTPPPAAIPPSSSMVLRFLRERTRLFDVIPTLESRVQKGGLYTLFKGFVQSGKSRLAYALIVYLTMEHGHNVCMILRDFTGDYTQFRWLGGLEPFVREMVAFARAQDATWSEEDEEMPPIHYLGDVTWNSSAGVLSKHEDMCLALASGGAIVLALANASQMNKMNEVWDLVLAEGNGDKTLSTIVDECDQLMYSDGDSFSPQLDRLLERSRGGIYGISATVMENLHDDRFSTSDVFVLAPPPDYKGVGNWIDPIPIEPVDEAIKKDSPQAFLEWDKDLSAFLVQDHPVFDIRHGEKHPTIALLKTERWIRHQDALLEAIVGNPRFKEVYTVIVYNGEDTKLYSPSLVGQKIRLPLCGKKENSRRSTDRFHVFRKCAIQYVLQYLKQNGGADVFPKILVISHGLVGRGVNIASADYGWHLTDMFFRPSKGISMATLLQSIRLCGIYRDTIRLHLYMEKRYMEEMFRGHQLEVDIMKRLGGMKESTDTETDTETDTKGVRTWLGNQHFLQEKIPKAKLVKHGAFAGKRTLDADEDEGMTMDEFLQDRCVGMPAVALAVAVPVPVAEEAGEEEDDSGEAEFRRLSLERFPLWANPSTTTKIARFMQLGLDPHKKYTEQEMKEVLTEYRIQLRHVLNPARSANNNYGILLWKNPDDHTYSLHPRLVDAFQEHF